MVANDVTPAEVFGVQAADDFLEIQEAISPRFSEDELALRFSRQHAEDLRYTARWGHWHSWDGTRWREDSTLQVFNRVRIICRAASAECTDAEKAIRSRLTAGSTVAAVERLARSDRRHAATTEQWDAGLWLLNTPTGTVDLRTGELHPHKREDYLTKSTAAGPGGECPLWRKFLQRVTGENAELQGFLQRMLGYSLTGNTSEHAIFFLWGLGANGKSVFLSVVSGLLGDYARTAPPSCFTATVGDQHPTDLAGLRGARFVSSIETEAGARWAESKIKSLTGGDAVSARFMRADFFTYMPEFKLVVAGNNKPGLRSVDEAIRRRLHLIPFTVTIPEAERDKNLADKLKQEYPGILSWAIQGCLDWQKQGLDSPEMVRAATSEYLAAEDRLGRWLDERCVTGRKYWTASGALFCDWKSWCDQTGEHQGSQKKFSQALEDHGFAPDRTRAEGRGYVGIGLKADA